MKRSYIFITVLISFAWQGIAQTISDYDGNVYDTIHIGSIA